MKKMIYISVLFFVVLLVGCVEKEEQPKKEVKEEFKLFEAENESWKVTMKVNNDSIGAYKLSVNYKKDLKNLQNVRDLEYTYKYGHGVIMSQTLHSDGNNTFDKREIMSNRGEMSEFDRDLTKTIPFEIRVDQKVEKLELVPEN